MEEDTVEEQNGQSRVWTSTMVTSLKKTPVMDIGEEVSKLSKIDGVGEEKMTIVYIGTIPRDAAYPAMVILGEDRPLRQSSRNLETWKALVEQSSVPFSDHEAQL